MKLLDLCCGAGGWSLGAKLAGWEVEGVDLNMDAVATYQANVGPSVCADIRHIRGMPKRGLFIGGIGTDSAIDVIEGDIRLVIGGVPCQPYSIAGKMQGDASEEGQLWLDWLRVAVELDAEAIALENVRGFASWQNGRFLGGVLRTIESKGYRTAWQVLDAADYGVPQHRDRVFLVGFRDPEARARFKWPEPSHGPPGHLWLPAYRTVRDALGIPLDEPSATVTTGGTDTGGAEPFANAAYRAKLRQARLDAPGPTITAKGYDSTTDPNRASRRPLAELRTALQESGLLNRPSTTICADPRLAPPGHHDHSRQEGTNTSLQPHHLAVLQDFPLHFRFAGKRGAQYTMIGNAVPKSLGAAVCRSIARALGT